MCAEEKGGRSSPWPRGRGEMASGGWLLGGGQALAPAKVVVVVVGVGGVGGGGQQELSTFWKCPPLRVP